MGERQGYGYKGIHDVLFTFAGLIVRRKKKHTTLNVLHSRRSRPPNKTQPQRPSTFNSLQLQPALAFGRARNPRAKLSHDNSYPGLLPSRTSGDTSHGNHQLPKHTTTQNHNVLFQQHDHPNHRRKHRSWSRNRQIAPPPILQDVHHTTRRPLSGQSNSRSREPEEGIPAPEEYGNACADRY